MQIFVFVLLAIFFILISISDASLTSFRSAKFFSENTSNITYADKLYKISLNPSEYIFAIHFLRLLSGVFLGMYSYWIFTEFSIICKVNSNYSLFCFFSNYGIPKIGILFLVFLISCLIFTIAIVLPRRICTQNPEKFLKVVYWFIVFARYSFFPFISLMDRIVKIILQFFGLKTEHNFMPVSDEEIKMLVKRSTDAGLIDKNEQVMVERILDFGDRKISSIMTSRPEMVWLDINDPIEVNKEKMGNRSHSYFPVSKGNLDNIIGIVHVKDLVAKTLLGEKIDLTMFLKPAHFIPEVADPIRILEVFKQSKTHVSLIINEFGTVQGIVTMTDIIEAIVGDLPTENSSVPAHIVKRDSNSWIVEGLTPIDNFKEVLGISEISGEDSGNFHTIAGFVMMQLGKIPKISDYFIWNNYRFEVVSMEGNRVQQIIVSKYN